MRNKQPANSVSSAYIELLKPNIMLLVLITTVLGFYLGGDGINSILIYTLLGTAMASGGAGALNHYLERDSDCLMERTKYRPLPAGIISPGNALLFGIILVLCGSTLLVWKVNTLTGFISLLTSFLYVLVYTPMKKITWLNTSIGSIPGALPIMGGWTAATGQIELGAWILFSIMFLWQHPHFFAIAWMCKDDYTRADFKMLPVIEPDGKSTIRQIFIFLLILIPVSVLPFFSGSSGLIYLSGVLVLSILFLLSALPMARKKSHKNAIILLKSSVVYLPALLILIVIDKII